VRNSDKISEKVYSSYGKERKEKKKKPYYKTQKNMISRFEKETFNDRGLNNYEDQSKIYYLHLTLN
jgi:hypothetical protein